MARCACRISTCSHCAFLSSNIYPPAPLLPSQHLLREPRDVTASFKATFDHMREVQAQIHRAESELPEVERYIKILSAAASNRALERSVTAVIQTSFHPTHSNDFRWSCVVAVSVWKIWRSKACKLYRVSSTAPITSRTAPSASAFSAPAAATCRRLRPLVAAAAVAAVVTVAEMRVEAAGELEPLAFLATLSQLAACISTAANASRRTPESRPRPTSSSRLGDPSPAPSAAETPK